MKTLVPALGLSALLVCVAIPAYAAALTDSLIDAAMKKADPDKDGTVSLDEALKFGLTKEAFEKANPDKDGTLDRKEFAKAVELQFETANPDKDGTLDWKEAQKAGIKDQKTFDAANPDKDGHLDLAEFLAALTLQAK
jgi:hypothetical protein